MPTSQETDSQSTALLDRKLGAAYLGSAALDRFPVHESGEPSLRDDFGAPRSGGRHHEGIDIFAPKGTPVLAVREGKARNSVENKGGRVVYLTAADGSRYYYAHLDNWFRLAEPGQIYDVRSGDVIGFVGDTGNAKGLPPHLHFQMAESGGPPINPFPALSAVATAPVKVDASKPAARVTTTQKQAGFGGLGLLVVLYLLMKGRRR